MKLNLGHGRYPLEGFVNIDERDGWDIRDGIPAPTGHADAVTISHVLMYVDLDAWPFVFSDLARVLRPAGVVRITEDETVDPASSRQGVQPGACVATTATLVLDHLAAAGLETHTVGPGVTLYRDRSLIQRWHGEPPDVFHVEGAKP